MPEYMALLYESSDDPGQISPDEIQQIIGKYKAWRDRMEAAGHLSGGQKLKDGEGRVLRAENGQLRVLDGPYSETKEVIGGYCALHASGYDEAVRLLEDNPHLEFGGTIELREVDEV
ncbi:MAG: transcription initiation protein [Acidobacteria bacterium]|nr:MAG: transcription initiation protein [Acidobacteriota bacterium]